MTILRRRACQRRRWLADLGSGFPVRDTSVEAAVVLGSSAVKLDPPRLSLAERLYLPEVLRGIAVTTRHFVRNLTLHTLHLFGLATDQRAAVTVQYPEERKVYPESYRGAHRLTLKPDDSVRCTAC